MIIRTLGEIKGTPREVLAENGNWRSHRLLLEADRMGFSFHDTTIYAGTRTFIHYKNHVEAVYCIEGRGAVELIDQGRIIPLSPGTLYGLDQHEKHFLIAETDLRIICVFNPPLIGNEDHDVNGSYPSRINKGLSRLTFAYLNLKEHPRGNYMLNCLIKAGFEPAAVIEEDSSLATKGRQNLNSELEKSGFQLPPSLAQVLESRKIHHHIVHNHNDEECISILTDLKPDLIVLGDTRIIKQEIIELASVGVVNVHPGYLPVVKGNNPYVWAIIHDLPQGCSVHFVDNDIDTGPIILRRIIRTYKGMTYPFLLHEINLICGDLLVESLYAICGGGFQGIPQSCFPNPIPNLPTFRLAPPEIKAEAIRKLEQGEYGGFDPSENR